MGFGNRQCINKKIKQMSGIKKIVALATTLCLVMHIAMAQSYLLADDNSSVQFKIKNFGSNVAGSFKGLKGKIAFDPAALSKASFFATVDVNTINTGNKSRDKHLVKDDYFNAAAFPTIQIASTKIELGAKAGEYKLTGTLTMKGTSKFIQIIFTATPTANGWLLKGELPLNRRDYKIGGNSMILSDNVIVYLNITANK
jgi:polyisoprenoid-binding protein YceI